YASLSSCFLQCYADVRDLPSFPTRRSSDLYFESQRDRIGERPASISFEQVVIAPKPSDSAREEALQRAQDVLRRIQDGESFEQVDRKSTRLNSSHVKISYAVFCLKKKKTNK